MNDASAAGAPTPSGWLIDPAARAAAIAAHDIDSLRGSAGLKQITDFAAQLCGTPVALINLVEEHRQNFITRTGYDAPEGPPETSFCTIAMVGDDIMVVPDATRDPRFIINPQVTGAPFIRFYAGVPLVADDGVPLGSLCVIDTVPHDGLTPLQYQGLTVLAEAAMARLRDSRDAAQWRATENATSRALNESHGRFRVLADAMPQMVWSTLPDGSHDYFNARWYDFTGVTPGSTDGDGWQAVLHADDRAQADTLWRHALESGEPYQIEYRLLHVGGDYRWALGRALPLRDDAGTIVRWFGTCTDIHEQKQASEEREIVAQELSHRIKNIFAVIAGLIGFTARSRPELAEIAADLRERITALSRAHDFVRPHSKRSRPEAAQNSLRGLLDELFRPYHSPDALRIAVTGADVEVDDRSATPLALMFHELATNATKYGALANDNGRIAIDIASGEAGVTLRWTEQGGPTVNQTANPGFGTQLIELSAVRQLGGTVSRDWRADGLIATIQIPQSAFSRR